MSDSGFPGAGRYMEGLSTAFAVTRGEEHSLVYANAAFRRLTGANGEVTIGCPLAGALSGPNTIALNALLDRVARTGVMARDERIDASDAGDPAWCFTVWPGAGNHGESGHLVIELRETTTAETTLALQRDLAGRMLVSALRERDLAERAEESARHAVLLADEAMALRAEAESANEAKSAFLGTMSHELRTPLNAIGGYVDLVDMGIHGPVTEAQHTALGRIRTNQQHLISLVSDVLNFALIGGGDVSYYMADVVASEILSDAFEMVEPLIRQKEIIFDGVTCDPEIVVRADQEKAKQVVVNILSNVVKFTPRGGRLVIDCVARDGVAVARFADTGIGIPPEKLEVIFDPFVQVRDGLAGRDAGVGLGLSISRDLARGMGGDLTVESVLGAGSTFTLTLPLASK